MEKRDDDIVLLNMQTLKSPSPAPLEFHGPPAQAVGERNLLSNSLAGQTPSRRAWATIASCCCLALAAMLILLLVREKHDDVDEDIHYECLYAVGGGTVGATGGFPQARLRENPECREAFDVYFAKDGQYFDDLDEAGDTAMEYYQKNYFPTANATQLLVFDIDETALSNLEHELRTGYGVDESMETWQQWELSASAPAIQPMLDVYVAAYNSGMSVAFVTGRFETVRNATVENLQKAGYGTFCAKDELGNVVRSTSPCYIRLDMRDVDADADKPASVYKPERRQQYLDEGYQLVGCFGDQFSDLEGLTEAVASWKLPNPMYFIL